MLPDCKDAAAGAAAWVWHPDRMRSADAGDASTFFVHRFSIRGNPRFAWMQVYTGCGYRLFVNGTQTGCDRFLGHATFRHDLKSLLRSGENIIAIEVYAGPIQPGLLVVGAVATEYDEQPIQTEPGRSWQTTEQKPAGWPILDGEHRWQDAVELTSYLHVTDDVKLKELTEGLSSSDRRVYESAIAHQFARGLDDITVQGTPITVVKNGGFFPVLQRTPGEDLAAVFRVDGPHVSREGKLAFTRSADKGATWSAPVIVASGDDPRNPAFCAIDDQTFVVAYCTFFGYDADGNWTPGVMSKPTELWTRRSEDGGKTWLPPVRLQSDEWNMISPHGRMVILPDGAILMSVYGNVAKAGESGRDAAGIMRSTDGGGSWSFWSIVAEGYNETTLCLRASGELLAILRSATPKPGVWLARSADSGRTWSQPVRMTGQEEYPGDVAEASDGTLVMVHGCRHFPYGTQCMISGDHGESWQRPERFALDAQSLTDDCGYPSIVPLDDNRLAVIYYTVGDRFNLSIGVHAAVRTFALTDLTLEK